MTKIKICGVTSIEDARKCTELGVDYLGVILSDSPRRAGLDAVIKIQSEAQGRADLVGVFAKRDDLLRFDVMTEIRLDYYQIYFEAPTGLHRQPRLGWLHARLVDEMTEPITVVNGDLSLLDYKNLPPEEMTRLLEESALPQPDHTFLAGNLTPDNVATAVARFRPYGVDVARGTERLPGVKDHDFLTRFVEAVRYADSRA